MNANLACHQAPGCDWAVLRLGVVGEILRLVVDTNHFKGNFPESVAVNACLAPDNDASVRSVFYFYFVYFEPNQMGKSGGNASFRFLTPQ